MRLNRISVGCVLILVSAAFAIAQKVNTDYDQGTDFSKYKTFMWIKQPEMTDPLMKQRLVDAVNARLAGKGMRLVTADADMGVAVNVATKEKSQLSTFYDGFGGWGWGMGGTATTVVDTYQEGTLVVDLFDTGAKRVIWRGTATATIPDKAQKKEEKVAKALDKMFKDFPPSKKISGK